MSTINEPRSNSNWKKVKDFINSIENESLVTRKRLIYNLPGVPHTTVDFYRRLLTDINVLTYIKPGKYKKVQNIPEKTTTTQILKFLNLPKWRRWFTPLEMFVDDIRKRKFLP
jgi:wyosine [tRNA(Phe)-imidazoG37] synthetase (radical SAM superfamily)